MAATRKKSQRGRDFKKVKHKVGRKLASSSNATKVDVKSKVITLPGQSVGQEKEGLSISSRRLTLKELLMQTTHHNDVVRKESLLGIKDLLSRHPKELRLHAVTIIEKLCPRISDKSKLVRHVLLDVVQTTIFPGLSEVLIRPLIPVIMAYIFSAMTTLAADVRMSAFRFLDVVIREYPTLITADYVTQITQGFVDFLSKLGVAGQTGGQLLEMLNILQQFLSAYQKRSRISKVKGFPNTKEGQKLKNPQSLENPGADFVALHRYKSVVPEFVSFWQVCSDKAINEQEFPLHLAESVVKALYNCWAECAPFVCSGQSPDKENMECMIKVCAALRLLISIIEPGLQWQLHRDNDAEKIGMPMQHSESRRKGAMVSKWIQEQMVPFLHHQLIKAFPISAPPINLPKEVEDLLLLLNISILEVSVDLIIAGNLQIHEETDSISRILNYFEDILDGRMRSALGLSAGSVHKKTMNSYLRLLVPFVPCLLSFISRERQVRLLKAFTNVFRLGKATSKLKHVCLSCVTEILELLNSSREQLSQAPLEIVAFDFQRQWLQMLPRLLWELKISHHASSLAILKVLHYLGRSAPQDSLLAAEFVALQPIMIPFFSTAHVSKLNQAQKKHGPFINLPAECQSLAIDLLYYYDRFSAAFLKAIAHCLCPDLEVILVVRCIEVIRAVYNKGSMELPDYLSFIMTVLLQAVSLPDDCEQLPLPTDSEIDRTQIYKRQRIVIGALCSCLSQVGDQRLVLHLLHPSMCTLMALSLSPLTSYGLLRIICMLGTFRNCLFVPKPLFELLSTFLKTYLLSMTMELCFKGRLVDGDKLLIGHFISPCLSILAHSANLTERVLHQLCSASSTDWTKVVSGRSHFILATVAVLIRVLDITSILSKISEHSTMLQRFKGDGWLDIFQVEEDIALSIFQKISQGLTSAYAWDRAVNHDSVAN